MPGSPLLQASDNMVPILQTIVITLFVLSMISERLTNFLKLNLQVWFPDPRRDPEYYQKVPPWRKRIGRCLLLKNLMRVEQDDDMEKARAGGVINLAVICGVLVAIMANADFFYIIVHGHTRSEYWVGTFPWEGWGWLEFLKKVAGRCIGWMLTGLFISLGSKFWHDLLDLLLYSSNLKRKLSDPNTFLSESASEVREFVELTPRELGNMALGQYAAELRKQPHVLDVVFGKKQVRGVVRDALIVYVTETPAVQPSAGVEVRLASGRKVRVPVVYEAIGRLPEAQFALGDSLRRSGSAFDGTLGCIFQGRDPASGDLSYFALTCNHVFTDNTTTEGSGGWIDNGTVRIKNHVLGKWRYGLFNRAFDIALVAIDPGQIGKYSDQFALNLKASVRVLTDADVAARLALTRHSTKRDSPAKGRLAAILESEFQIKYNDKNHGIAGLLEIAGFESGRPRAISRKGDSGALVYDDNGELAGMIIAGNDEYSYAIPMTTIERKLKTVLLDFEIIVLPKLPAL